MAHKRSLIIALDEDNKPLGVELVDNASDVSTSVHDAAETAERQTDDAVETISSGEPITGENMPELIKDVAELPPDIATPIIEDIGESSAGLTSNVSSEVTETGQQAVSTVEEPIAVAEPIAAEPVTVVESVDRPSRPVIVRRHRFGR